MWFSEYGFHAEQGYSVSEDLAMFQTNVKIQGPRADEIALRVAHELLADLVIIVTDCDADGVDDDGACMKQPSAVLPDGKI